MFTLKRKKNHPNIKCTLMQSILIWMNTDTNIIFNITSTSFKVYK